MKICGWTESVGGYIVLQQNISQHVDNIYKDGELFTEATNKKFLLVRREGNRQVRRNIDHYNLDMVIALGYRVQLRLQPVFSPLGDSTASWIYPKRDLLWMMAVEARGNRYFRELLQRIRIFVVVNVTSINRLRTYMPQPRTITHGRDDKDVFATVQNKLPTIVWIMRSRLWVWRTSKATMWLRMMWRLPRTICQK